MGLRLRFGVGPLRASVPLTKRRRRRRKRRAKRRASSVPYTSSVRYVPQRFRGVAPLPDGSVHTCHHQHITQQTAADCANRYLRNRAILNSVLSRIGRGAGRGIGHVGVVADQRPP